MKDRAEAGRADRCICPGLLLTSATRLFTSVAGIDGCTPSMRRRHADLRDRREVAHRIVRHLAVEAGIDGVSGHRRHQQRVAVGSGFRDRVGADIAARARPVLHEELLAEQLRHPGAHDAGDDVGRAAGGKRHHDADRFRWIGVLGAAPRSRPARWPSRWSRTIRCAAPIDLAQSLRASFPSLVMWHPPVSFNSFAWAFSFSVRTKCVAGS